METSSKLYSSSSSAAMDEAVNINTNNNNNSRSSKEGMINSMSSSNSSRRHRSKEMENLSFELSKYPRDLLQTFMGNNSNNNNSNQLLSTRSSNSSSRSDEGKLGGGEEEEDDEGLNLGLGLSLGGIFGVDKSKNKGLIRSSSIAGTMPLYKDDDMGVAPPPTPGSNLARTASLPVETEEEWRKRKDMQTLRRMEAKRRRSEKQRVLKETGVGGVLFGVGGGGGSGGSGGSSGGEEKGGGGVEGLKLRARLEREQQCLGITSKLIGSSMGSLFGSPKPPQPSNNTNTNNPPTPSEVKGRRTTFGSLQGFLTAQAQTQAPTQTQTQSPTQSPTQSQYLHQYQSQSLPHNQPQQGSSQGSEGSQGATSSDASEFESKPLQGSSSCGEARSPASIHSQQDRGSQESFGHSITKDDPMPRVSRPEAESLSKQPESANNKRKGTAGSSGIEDMPCVFTIGDGPNGRKVEGILYKYGKGEEVRIMCVCHGSFFSPSEFVKHAGGKDVEHPLRHIVVSPSSSAFQ